MSADDETNYSHRSWSIIQYCFHQKFGGKILGVNRMTCMTYRGSATLRSGVQFNPFDLANLYIYIYNFEPPDFKFFLNSTDISLNMIILILLSQYFTII